MSNININNLIRNGFLVIRNSFADNIFIFIKFSIVGFIGYIINLSIYSICIYFLGFYYLFAATISFIAAVTSNYVLNHYFTFKVNGSSPNLISYSRFVSICLFGYAVNMVVLFILVDKIGFGPVISQLIAVGVASVSNFIGSKLFVFIKIQAN